MVLEAITINPEWVGYLAFGGRPGLGQYDLPKIQLVGGTTAASVQKKYPLSDRIQRELQWMGPMAELPHEVTSLPEAHQFSVGRRPAQRQPQHRRRASNPAGNPPAATRPAPSCARAFRCIPSSIIARHFLLTGF